MAPPGRSCPNSSTRSGSRTSRACAAAESSGPRARTGPTTTPWPSGRATCGPGCGRTNGATACGSPAAPGSRPPAGHGSSTRRGCSSSPSTRCPTSRPPSASGPSRRWTASSTRCPTARPRPTLWWRRLCRAMRWPRRSPGSASRPGATGRSIRSPAPAAASTGPRASPTAPRPGATSPCPGARSPATASTARPARGRRIPPPGSSIRRNGRCSRKRWRRAASKARTSPCRSIPGRPRTFSPSASPPRSGAGASCPSIFAGRSSPRPRRCAPWRCRRGRGSTSSCPSTCGPSGCAACCRRNRCITACTARRSSPPGSPATRNLPARS